MRRRELLRFSESIIVLQLVSLHTLQVSLPPLMLAVSRTVADGLLRSDCWDRQMLHREGKKGLDNMPHERVNPDLVPLIEGVFNPSNDRDVVEKLRECDKSSKWVDVVRDAFGRYVLEDYGCYSSLFAQTSAKSAERHPQFPQLVSFIGDANAGKSTLIKLLIDRSSRRYGSNDGSEFASPVVGGVADSDTSGTCGLKFYKDPVTSKESRPLVFIDSEGFQGGGQTSGLREESDAFVRTRSIEWADPETQEREPIVEKLYPRLLYTFSDCLVFVTRNPKGFESTVLTKLIDWGVANMERSINQPTLPHCIVVLNCSDASLDEDRWHSDRCTEELLSRVYLECRSSFLKQAHRWRELGQRVNSTKDLILRYYSSFRVLRIPVGSQFNRVANQITKLDGMIGACCQASFLERERTNMRSDISELGKYLESGLEHFTTHKDLPFDFVQTSLAHNPVSDDFGDHILQLCLAVQHAHSNSPNELKSALEHMSSYVASCVFLDWARYRKGPLEQHSGSFELCFGRAISDFLRLHIPCGYATDGRKCASVEARHRAKGHQDQHGIIAYGGFEPPFGLNFAEECKERFERSLQFLSCCLRENGDVTINHEQVAWKLHLDRAALFLKASEVLRLNFTCVCCLTQTPAVTLPCGHVLCRNCVGAFGRREEHWLVVDHCRLHGHTRRWKNPTRVRIKAPEDGVCVLSLDDGGIRGIVQLEILRAIEVALGGHLPVHKFFDLIVGAGTGGLIAALLVKRGWTIDRCLSAFKAVQGVAYDTGKSGGSFLQRLGNPLQRRKIRSTHLHQALKEVFTSQSILFGEADQFASDARMAISSSSGANGQPVLFANYRCSHPENSAYSVWSSSDPREEVCTWEAVGAALADGGSSPSIKHSKGCHFSKTTRKANPERIAAFEANHIWKENCSTLVCLSLGTGQDGAWIARTLSEATKGGTREYRAPVAAIKSPLDRRKRCHIRNQRKILAAETEWKEFKLETEGAQPHAKAFGLVRLNPDFGRDLPEEDEYESLDSLQRSTKSLLQQPIEREAAKRVAHRLVATCFYLCTDHSVVSDGATLMVSAQIACRFEGDTESMCGLGRTLRCQFRDSFEPYFEVRPVADCAQTSSTVSLTMDTVVRMADLGAFQRPHVTFSLDVSLAKASSIQLFFMPDTDGLSLGYPLSGLPRKLVNFRHCTIPGSQPVQILENMHQRLTLEHEKDDLSQHPHSSMLESDHMDGRSHNALSHPLLRERIESWDSTDGRVLSSTDSYDVPQPRILRSPTHERRAGFLPRRLVLQSRQSSDRAPEERQQSTLLPPPVGATFIGEIQDRSNFSPTGSTISSDFRMRYSREADVETTEVRSPPQLYARS